jgi:16S rRNA (cytosine967-C5)-methyltransferase
MKQFPRQITELNLRAQVVITLLQVQQGQSLASLLHQQLK